MTTTLSGATLQIIQAQSDGARSIILGAIVVPLILVLVVSKELTWAANNLRTKPINQAFNVVIVPLLLAFGLIVVVRLADLLRSS